MFSSRRCHLSLNGYIYVQEGINACAIASDATIAASSCRLMVCVLSAGDAD